MMVEPLTTWENMLFYWKLPALSNSGLSNASISIVLNSSGYFNTEVFYERWLSWKDFILQTNWIALLVQLYSTTRAQTHRFLRTDFKGNVKINGEIMF